jgi:MoaA/NifB/PqqE/SkfB family radical SAM enzyme
MIWNDRLRALLLALKRREAWRLPFRSSCGLLKAFSSTRPASAKSGTIVYANCPPIGTKAFGRYLGGIRRMTHGELVPLVVHIAVTDRCGYNCARCSNMRAAIEDPTIEEIRKLLSSLVDAGTASIAFTGGEPNLRDDLPEIIKSCRGLLSPILFTSGQGMDSKRAMDLNDSGLDAVFISLDHYDKAIHDGVRGKEGAFNCALSAIRACISAGLYTAAQAVVDNNLARETELVQFLKYCKELGVHEVVLLEPLPRFGTTDRPGINTAQKELIRNIHMRAARDASLPKVTAMSFFESADFYGCQAGYSFFYVNTSGEAFPCDFTPFSFGNVYELGVETVLARMADFFIAPSKRCLACDLHERQGTGSHFPVAWPRVWEIMQNYTSGEAPSLMRSFMPRRNDS